MFSLRFIFFITNSFILYKGPEPILFLVFGAKIDLNLSGSGPNDAKTNYM